MTELHDIPPEGIPKRQILELAFDDCGLAGFEFDIQPEEVSMALRKLNALMREWPWNQLGYAQPEYGVGLPEDLSGIPDDTINVVAAQLTLRLAPEMGKSLSAEFSRAAARSLLLFQSQYATVPAAPLAPNTPRGAGNRAWTTDPFIEG